MLRGTALGSPGAHGLDIGLGLLLIGTIRAGCKSDESVKRNREPGTVLLIFLHEVGVDAADDGLVTDDQDILTALKLHDDGLQSDDHVAVRLAASVAVVVLVLVTGLEVLWVAVLDLLVCHAVAEAGVQLVQRLPLELVVVLGQEARCGDCALESGRPDCQRAVIANGRADHVRKLARILLASVREGCITTNASVQVQHRLTMLAFVS
jgi:hypothetical protein